ncbi:MAG: transaldolase [Candidatus Bathyarchaeota archaeon]|nr:transaldolase [Candidatus Bathyarchaeota archaeon]
MKIFIDTADLNEINEAVSWGVVDGVTTNPSLIKKAVDRRDGKVTMEEYIKEIVKVVPGPVSLEVIGGTSNNMVAQGKLLYGKFSPYGEVAIKIPVNPSMRGDDGIDFEGLKAIRRLSTEGIPINVTLIMTPEQALLAAKAGAAYASPFAGRIDDYIRSKLGMKRGADFQKGDYFDHELLGRTRERKLSQTMDGFSPVSEVYRSEEVRSLAETGRDNGVLSGVDLVAQILRIYRNYGFKTEVIAASIRNPRQAREMAELGVHIATLPFDVIKGMIGHYKTVEGMKSFTADIVPQYRDTFKRK